MVRFRLGLPVFDQSGPCVACGRDSDNMGIHAVGCAGQGQRIARHNVLRDILFQTAKQAQLAPTKEERYLFTQAARVNERPGDIVIPSFSAGRDCVIDIAVVSSQQNLLVDRAGADPGSALTQVRVQDDQVPRGV